MSEKPAEWKTRLGGYLSSAPGGLAAFPSAAAKGSLVRGVLDGQPLEQLARLLPEPLAAWIVEPPMGSEWIPEAQLVALVHAVGDLQGWSEAEAGAWAREWSRRVFESPAYRILMAAPSPASQLRSAGIRWGAFHRGSVLEVEGISDDGVRLSLRFPPGLFDAPYLTILTQYFAAALEMSRAPGAEVALEDSREGFARFVARW